MEEIRKIAPRTLAEMKKNAFIDKNKVNATTDEDIKRHAKEDETDNDPDDEGIYPMAYDVRKRLGLTQREMAHLLHIPLRTWQNWEQGTRATPPIAKTFLRALWYAPEAIIKALHKQAA